MLGFFIVQYVEVILVTHGMYLFFFNGLFYCAPWFMHMGAVVIFAIFGIGKNFRKEVREFVIFDIYQSKTFNSRGVDDIATLVQGMHFGKSGGMFSGLMGFREGLDLQIQPWLNCFYQARFSHTGITGND